MPHNLFSSLQDLPLPSGRKGKYYALPALEAAGLGKISRMPHSLRIVLESVLRNCDGKRVTEEHVRELAAWKPNETRTAEIPFVLARILLQDMAGFPALNDFAAMRNAAQKLGGQPSRIEARVPTPCSGTWSSSFSATASVMHFSSGASRRLKAYASCRRAMASSVRSTS